MKRTMVLTLLVFFLSVQASWGDIPETISYQGVLTDASGTPVPDDAYELTFSIYDVDTGGTELWSENHSSVAVSNGIFSVILGSINSLDIPFDRQYWLGMRIDMGPELEPRTRLTSSAYSLGGDFWRLSGNAGTNPTTNFLGTVDNQPLELRVFGACVLRLEPHSTSPNIVGGYSGNSVTSGVYGATIGGGGVSGTVNRVTDHYGTIGGGRNNQAGEDATVAGGWSNYATGDLATVGGGNANTANGWGATVGGGHLNTASGGNATIGGGEVNAASSGYAVVGGGYHNTASAYLATIAGGGSITEGKGNRVTDNYGTVGGGENNQAGDDAGTVDDKPYATVGGGDGNTASGYYATVGGGLDNATSGLGGTIGGGGGNTASGTGGTIGGGHSNTASGNRAAIGGGWANTASSYYATVGGGQSNTASDFAATVGGGYKNAASGGYATVPGGAQNSAMGEYSFAAGRGAQASHAGSFVWSGAMGASGPNFLSVTEREFAVRCRGGARFVTEYDSTGAPTRWAYLNPDTAQWEVKTPSDVNLKDSFAPVDGVDILKHLASMPVQTWSYSGEDASIRHIGPTSQDFYAAFGMGRDDGTIGVLDAEGVALAAIQGLYEIVQEKDAKIATQQQQITALEERLEALEALVLLVTQKE